MKKLNNSGFALVTALMITMISLVIIMAVMTSVIQGQRTTASTRTYRNALEAARGGTEVMAYEIIPLLSVDTISTVTGRMADLVTKFGATNLEWVSSSACVDAKLNNDNSLTNWTTPCGPNSVTTLIAPDLTYNLRGTNGNTFRVSSTIVDSSPGVPYPPGGSEANTGGVVNRMGGTGGFLLAHYVYRIEVAAVSTSNTAERGSYSVIYEY